MGVPGTVYVTYVWFKEPVYLPFAFITSLNLHLWLIFLFMKLLFLYMTFCQERTIDVSLETTVMKSFCTESIGFLA